MMGSILPYHERLRDSKVTASLRISMIQFLRTTTVSSIDEPIQCRERLGGMLNYYYREAA
jgi:hypothetical protein